MLARDGDGIAARELLGCLRAIRRVRFVACASLPPDWNGIGTGTVDAAVDESGDGSVVFTESGTWRPTAGSETKFGNIFAWSREADRVRLAHLRFGPKRPVHLVDLAPRADGSWACVAAHPCGADTYVAELRPTERGLALVWEIRGPAKHVRLEYAYERGA